MKDSPKDDDTIKRKEANQVPTQLKKTGEEMHTTKRMKQLELNWKMHMHPKVDEPAKAEKMATPKVKDTKKEAMRKAAESSMRESNGLE